MIHPRSMREEVVDILRPLQRTTWRFRLVAGLASLGVLLGGYAYTVQLTEGLGATGLNRPVYWGFYMSNFVFFIAISFGGTLLSAVLRLMGADWRHPVTRAAEGLTVVALIIGAPQVILDLGRPDRIGEVFLHGRLQSPILWDILAITLYFFVSVLFLYIPLIPDLAFCRDHLATSPWRRKLYRILSLGWSGDDRSLRRMHAALGIVAVGVIPLAVMVHSVLAWVFSVTVQPGWHSTIFGPYFVVGAVFSGLGAVIFLLAILRRGYHLQRVLTEAHFRYLGRGMLFMSLLWGYFTFAELLTSYCAQQPHELAVIESKLWGAYRIPFWSMVALCFALPSLSIFGLRPTVGVPLAGISVNVGMWLERLLIVVPTLAHPRIPTDFSAYSPSWVEWSLFIGSVSGVVLLYAIFAKLVPVVSIWEMFPSPWKSAPTRPLIMGAEEPDSSREHVGIGA